MPNAVVHLPRGWIIKAGMNMLIIILIICAAAGTGFVLVRGLLTLGSGKDISGAQSNKLMSMRVGLQALTILLVLLLLAIGGRGLGG